MNVILQKRRFVALGVLALLVAGLLYAGPGFAAPPDRAAIESVILAAPQKGGPDPETAFQWASSLDPLAQGLAKLLRDPAALAALQAKMAASPLPENTVRLLDLLDARIQGRRERLGALLAKAAGATEEELRAALAALPAPITLFFPREEDRRAALEPRKGRGPLDLQVTWDAFWIPQANLTTLLAYDHTGKQTSYSVDEPPAGPVLVVSTENSEAPEPPPAASSAASAVPDAVTKTTCSNPFLELTHVYLVTDHEGWPRGKPEFEIFLADWNSSMPGNELVIQPTTRFIFSGRYIADAAGRSRYLLDVNDKGRWYGFTPPIAMFAYNPYIGTGLFAVEDDEKAGELALSGNYSIGFTCSIYPGCTGPQCSGCKPTGSGLVNLARAILGSGDDKFPVPFRSVGGAPFGTIIEADMGEWRLRYRLACP